MESSCVMCIGNMVNSAIYIPFPKGLDLVITLFGTLGCCDKIITRLCEVNNVSKMKGIKPPQVDKIISASEGLELYAKIL